MGEIPSTVICSVGEEKTRVSLMLLSIKVSRRKRWLEPLGKVLIVRKDKIIGHVRIAEYAALMAAGIGCRPQPKNETSGRVSSDKDVQTYFVQVNSDK